jgi:hypothetical protein
MLASILQNPALQSTIVPLVAALVLTGGLRLALGPRNGPLLASAGIALGFLVALWTVQGLPPLPPRASNQKILYLVLLGLAVGLALDLTRARRILHWAAIVVLPLVSFAWIGERPVFGDPAGTAPMLLVVWTGTALALFRLHQTAREGATAPVMLMLVAFGVAGIAMLATSASMFQLALALGFAAAGFLVWNWPKPRYPLGATGLLGAGMALVAIVDILALFTRTNVLGTAVGLAVLFGVFFADRLARRISLQASAVTAALRPVMLGLVCVVVVGLALAAASAL